MIIGQPLTGATAVGTAQARLGNGFVSLQIFRNNGRQSCLLLTNDIGQVPTHTPRQIERDQSRQVTARIGTTARSQQVERYVQVSPHMFGRGRGLHCVSLWTGTANNDNGIALVGIVVLLLLLLLHDLPVRSHHKFARRGGPDGVGRRRLASRHSLGIGLRGDSPRRVYRASRGDPFARRQRAGER